MMRRQFSHAKFALRSAIFLLAGLALLQIGADSVQAQTESPNSTAPLCRMGVNVNSYYDEPRIEVFDTAPLRIGWYIDYNARGGAARPQGMMYAPVIRLVQDGEDDYNTGPSGMTLDNAIRAHAGKGFAWIVGNEPDRPGPFQDDMMPSVYAKAYHELRARIKAIDPTARVLAGAIVQATPVRMQYLDQILAAHQERYGEPMEVDGWAFHGFVLNEVSCSNNPGGLPCWGAEIPPGVNVSTGLVIDAQDNDDLDIFQDNVVRMRQWMADNGYRNVPLYLSEYGVLMPAGYGFSPDFTPVRVNQFMNATFDYLLNEAIDDEIGYPADNNRLVQYLAWYSTSGKFDANQRPGEFNGYLFDPDRGYSVSAMGENYRDYAAGVGYELDFTPLELSVESPIFVLGDQALVVVGVEVANAGHNLYPANVPVRLYQGTPDAELILGDGTVGVTGCGERSVARVTIRLPWNGEAPDTIDVTAIVNPDNTVDETDVSDNTMSGSLDLSDITVVFPLGSVFLPLLNQ